MTTTQALALLCAGLTLASYQRSSLALLFAFASACLSIAGWRAAIVRPRRRVRDAFVDGLLSGLTFGLITVRKREPSRLEARHVDIGDPGR